MNKKKPEHSIQIIVAIIGATAVCIAAIIGLMQPIVNRWVDRNFPTNTPSFTVTAASETPFTGTWQGIDPVDSSIITISLVQTGSELMGTLTDAYSGDLPPPGYHGNGSGTITSPVTAQIIFSNLVRSDGKIAEWEFELTLSNEKNSLTVNRCFFKDKDYEGSTDCPTILQRK